MDFTQEQNNIFNSNENVILIKAFAGTGKTTTLVEFAKRRPSSKFLYLAFNSGVVESSKYKFPKNVKVSTLHGIAYKDFGLIYEKKLEKQFKAINIIDELGLARSNKKHLELAKIILDIINNYTNSAYKKLEDAIPYESKYSRSELLDYSEKIWFSMINNTSDFPCTHDAYLKLYQLSETKLNYDYILFDEAQDANPVIVDIIMQQVSFSNMKLVVVGDNHQSIYAFRNAINSLSKFNHQKEFHLSKSFRFGANIAHATNAILKSLKGEKIELTGSDIDDRLVDGFDNHEKFAIIARTNACLFLKAVQAIEKNKKIHFITGFNKYNFYKILDIEHLYYSKNNKIRDIHIKEYETYQNFIQVAESTQDKEMLFLRKIVDKYHGKIEALFQKIKQNSVDDPNNADIVLTTAHKAKGLEFENVFLCNDFAIFIDNKGEINLRGWKEEEINILYVAVSRAIRKLRPNPSLRYVIKYFNEHKIKGTDSSEMIDTKKSTTGSLNRIKNKIKTLK